MTDRKVEEQSSVPQSALDAVLVASEKLPADTPRVRGYDFNNGPNVEAVVTSLATTGFQATAVGEAIATINAMLSWRLSDEPIKSDDAEQTPEDRAAVRTKIFLGYTSNLVSSGVRETIRYLAQHKLVDVIVATAGGVEEDLIKCLADTYVGDFALEGAALRRRGLNRIGNLLVPNDNYCLFEDWVMPILDAMLEEQTRDGTLWTPSAMIHRLGREINNEDSIYYWCYRNNIPVFCPALTDGSLGDMIYMHSFRRPGLVVDIARDIRLVNSEAVFAKRTGMVILGGGVVKHHICNANLMRNGADYAVFINTANEFDGSDAGARPDEAVSWGKIRATARSVKVAADATVVFPLIAAMTFARTPSRA